MYTIIKTGKNETKIDPRKLFCKKIIFTICIDIYKYNA